MNKIFAVFLILGFSISPTATFAQKAPMPELKQLQGPQNPRLGLVIHGGAGVIKRGSLSPEREKLYRAKMEEALLAGYKALQDGKTSVDGRGTFNKKLYGGKCHPLRGVFRLFTL